MKVFYISVPNFYFFVLPTVFGNHVHTTLSVTSASYRMWHKDACFTCPFLCDWKSQRAGNFVVNLKINVREMCRVYVEFINIFAVYTLFSVKTFIKIVLLGCDFSSVSKLTFILAFLKNDLRKWRNKKLDQQCSVDG